MKRLKFNGFALAEIIEAVHYYEKGQVGLGKAFLARIRKALDHILTFPDSGTPFPQGIRRHTVRRFPYSVIYSNEPEHIYIVAIMHHSRNPDPWKDNLNKRSD